MPSRSQLPLRHLNPYNYKLLIRRIIGPTYEDYVISLSPELWYRHRETSGTDIFDSSGNTHTGTLTLGAGALAQDGANAAGEAILSDASTTKIEIPSSAALKNAAYTFAFLCKPTGAGESAIGQWFGYSDAGDTSLRYDFTSQVLVHNIGATSNGQAKTTTAVKVTLNEWQWIFATLSNVDKKPRLYKGINGTLTEFLYTTSTAWSGTQNGAAILTFLNNAGGSRTWEGLFDEVIYIAGEPDSNTMQRLINLSGV